MSACKGCYHNVEFSQGLVLCRKTGKYAPVARNCTMHKELYYLFLAEREKRRPVEKRNTQTSRSLLEESLTVFLSKLPTRRSFTCHGLLDDLRIGRILRDELKLGPVGVSHKLAALARRGKLRCTGSRPNPKNPYRPEDKVYVVR